jgi:hypothetical protein
MKILVLLLLLVATPAWAQVDLCVRVGAQVNEVCQNIPAGAQPDLNAARIHYNARLNLQLTPSQFALELLKRDHTRPAGPSTSRRGEQRTSAYRRRYPALLTHLR